MAHFELSPSRPTEKPEPRVTLPGQIGSEVAARSVLWLITLRWVVVGVFLAVEIAAVLISPALQSQYGIEVPSRWPWIQTSLEPLSTLRPLSDELDRSGGRVSVSVRTWK